MNAIEKIPTELESAIRAEVVALMGDHGGVLRDIRYGADHDGDECLIVTIAYDPKAKLVDPRIANTLDHIVAEVAWQAGEKRLIYVRHQFGAQRGFAGFGSKLAPSPRRA